MAVSLLLDPWLQRQLGQQVARRTHGQYRPHVGARRTSRWQRAVRLTAIGLRPAATATDTRPRIRLDVARLNVTSTREPRFSVFPLWRQGIVSGLFHSIGVPQKLAQKLSESKAEAPRPR